MSTGYDPMMLFDDDPEKRARIARREAAMAELRATLAARRKEGPRHRTPDHLTSVEGAKDVEQRAPNQKIQLLRSYAYAGHRGFTDEQAAQHAGLTGTCFWKRCGELRARGWIEQPEGEPTRKGSAGVGRIICTITVEGQAYLRSLRQAG